MQTASIILAIGGNRDMEVPKFEITPAEVLLLQAIHGDEAVTEIDINGNVERGSREERERLFAIYAKAVPGGPLRSPELDALFPGVAAKLPNKFSEIEIDDAFYKAQARKTPAKADPLDHDGDGEKGGTAPSTEEGYKAMTVVELKDLAEQRAVDLTGASKKDEIIAKLEEADKAADAGEDHNLFT